MAILAAMFYGLIAAAITFVVAAFSGAALAGTLHMSNMEGGRGYFAAGIGLIAAIVAFFVAVVWTLRSRGVTSVASILGYTFGSVLALAAVVGLSIGLYWMSQPHILAQPTPLLEFQIMAPSTASLPDATAVQAELQTNRNAMPARWNHDKPEMFNGHPVLAGYVEMYYRTSQRNVVLTLPNRDIQMFQVRLPSDPTAPKYRTWSSWQKAEFAGGPSELPARVGADHAYQIRYQVEAYDRP